MVTPTKPIPVIGNILTHSDTTFEKGVLKFHLCMVQSIDEIPTKVSFWTLHDIKRHRGEIYSFYGKKDLSVFVEEVLNTHEVESVEFIVYNVYSDSVKERVSVIRYSSISSAAIRLKDINVKTSIMLGYRDFEDVEELQALAA